MRQIIIIALVLSLCFTWGCAGQTNEADQQGATLDLPAAQSVAPASNTDFPGGSSEGVTTVVGKVERIVGNEVTLELGELSGETSIAARGGGATKNSEEAAGQQGPDSSKSSGLDTMPKQEEMPSGQASPLDGDMPAGTGDHIARGASLSITYIGETVTYLLPVGMAIGSGDFASVTEGMVLSITMNGQGAITAVSVLAQ